MNWKQQIQTTLQRITVAKRNRKTGGYPERNVDQVCCLTMNKNTAAFNTSDDVSMREREMDDAREITVEAQARGDRIQCIKKKMPQKDLHRSVFNSFTQ